MQKKLFNRVVLGICAMVALTSCGGEKASGTGEFATVFVTPTGPAGPLDSDVITWVDATGAAATKCDPASLMSTKPDSVNYTLTSTAYTPPNTGSSTSITPSPVVVSRVIVSLSPADTTSPNLSGTRYGTFDVSASAPQINPGGSQPVSVRIVDNDLKSFFVSSLGAQSITCSNQVEYKYWATVTFVMREVSTNRESNVTPVGRLLINFSDFIDP